MANIFAKIKTLLDYEAGDKRDKMAITKLRELLAQDYNCDFDQVARDQLCTPSELLTGLGFKVRGNYIDTVCEFGENEAAQNMVSLMQRTEASNPKRRNLVKRNGSSSVKSGFRPLGRDSVNGSSCAPSDSFGNVSFPKYSRSGSHRSVGETVVPQPIPYNESFIPPAESSTSNSAVADFVNSQSVFNQPDTRSRSSRSRSSRSNASHRSNVAGADGFEKADLQIRELGSYAGPMGDSSNNKENVAPTVQKRENVEILPRTAPVDAENNTLAPGNGNVGPTGSVKPDERTPKAGPSYNERATVNHGDRSHHLLKAVIPPDATSIKVEDFFPADICKNAFEYHRRCYNDAGAAKLFDFSDLGLKALKGIK